MKRLVILNPTARRASRTRRLLSEMAAAPDTQLRETSGPGDAADLARWARSERVSEIVSAGGDGTLNEIVNGLAPFRRRSAAEDAGADPGPAASPVPAVGLLPLGTGNDVARSLGVPLDPEDARRVLEEGSRRTIDLGRVAAEPERERYFVNSAIAGVGGLAERRLSPRLKRWLGAYAYRVMVVSALRDVPRYRVTVEWDGGRESLRAVAYSVILANGSRAGGGIPVAPEARMDDGLLDVMVVGAGPAKRVPGLVWDVMRGRHPGREDVSHVRAESVTLRSRPPVWVGVDGEVFGDGTVSVEVVPRALRVIVPESDDDHSNPEG